MSRTYTVVLCSTLACMVAGEAPQIRTVDKSIELNVPDGSDVVFNVGTDQQSISAMAALDADVSADVAELKDGRVADSSENAAQRASLSASIDGLAADAVGLTGTVDTVVAHADSLNVSVAKVNKALFGRTARGADDDDGADEDDEESGSKGLVGLNVEQNDLLTEIRDAMSQVVVNTNPGATISYMVGCNDDDGCENGSEEAIAAVGRNFIPNVKGLYTCVFVAFGDTEKPVVFKRKAGAVTANRLNCQVPTLQAKEVYEAEFGVTLTVVEGASTDVFYLGDDEPVFSMRAGGPAIKHIDDVSMDSPDDDKIGKVEVHVTDIDSEKFEFAVASKSEDDIFKDVAISKSKPAVGLVVYTINSGVSGKGAITVTVTDDHENEQSHTFTVTVEDPMDDNIHAVRCDEITLSGAGGQGAPANGVYRKVKSYFKGWPLFCKMVGGKPMCHSQNGNRRDSRIFSYDGQNWGVQTNSGCGMHHRYYANDQGYSETISKAFNRIRGCGSSCVCGSNPTPTAKCTKEKFQKKVETGPGEIDVRKCKTIAVHGNMGTEPAHIGGLYSVCGTNKLNGYPVFGKHMTHHFDNVPDRWDRPTPPRCGAFNGRQSRIYFDAGWGWGIQTNGISPNGLHHRYSTGNGSGKDKDGNALASGDGKDGKANQIDQFTYVRSGYAAAPHPEITCVEFL